jgi:hypothetical protein
VSIKEIAGKVMLKEMTAVATECLKHPRGPSIYVPRLGRYVCPDSEEAGAIEQALSSEELRVSHEPPAKIGSQFKLVFLTAAAGTLLFVLICVVLTMLAGKQPPPLLERLVVGLFDLAKIGFGAIVGLLGGKSLESQGT